MQHLLEQVQLPAVTIVLPWLNSLHGTSTFLIDKLICKETGKSKIGPFSIAVNYVKLLGITDLIYRWVNPLRGLTNQRY